jgi:tetratricopeptide (TPR) repeat protein
MVSASMSVSRAEPVGLEAAPPTAGFEPDAEWLAAACLGARLPEKAELHLRLAGLAYQHDALAESHLHQAQASAPEHPAVLIGLYRFYFYKGRLAEALGVARQCLTKAARDNRLDADWRKVQAGDANFGSYEAILPRFYLFTLKGYAYLHMRLGDLEEGRAALLKLMDLDPTDKLGAKVLLNVLARMGRDSDYDDDD